MTDDQQNAAIALWCAGFDTSEIARMLGLPEAAVYNWIAKRPQPTRRAA